MTQKIPSSRNQEVLYREDGQTQFFPASESTRSNYEAQWNRLIAWADANDLSHRLPLESAVVVRYLQDRYEGNLPPAVKRRNTPPTTPGTIRVAVAAISYMHRRSRFPNPCESVEVRATVDRITREHKEEPRFVSPLDREAFEQIKEVVTFSRIGRGGQPEQRHRARRRGEVDIALIGLMRDAMLRVSEAANLTWGEIEAQKDGSGRITFASRNNELSYVSPETMSHLRKIRRGAEDEDPVFKLNRTQITARIRKAAKQAGLSGDFNGLSPRIGMVHDMNDEGANIYEIQRAGRWRSVEMPARYLRPENVEPLPIERRLYGGDVTDG